ncbi:hypothetical protein ACH5RR_001308 [Cinchona calisaya]|uniref:Uncharacterized protein n=1 Tax=Cinchona calisaya TaxID=153742 RepID=A0ABD3B477_9GENT
MSSNTYKKRGFSDTGCSRASSSKTSGNGASWKRNKVIQVESYADPFGHVIKDIASRILLASAEEQEDNIDIERLQDQRSDLKVVGRWHGIPVLKAYTNWFRGTNNWDRDFLLSRLDKERVQMKRRLENFHKVRHARKQFENSDAIVKEIEEDPNLVSDPELLDYTNSKDTNDFVRTCQGKFVAIGNHFAALIIPERLF